MNNNFNLDENTMNNIKNMVDNGDISGALSQISPEMIENVSKMINNQKNSNNSSNSNQNNLNNNYTSSNQNNSNNNSNSSNQNNSNNNYTSSNQNNSNNNSNSSSQNNPNIDLSNIDPATIMKITSAFGKMNNKNDPRANLLYSLKPYLRDGRKEKLDQYVNLLNITKVADILKDDKKENRNG